MRELIGVAEKKYGQHSIEKYDGETLEVSQLTDIFQGATLFSPHKLVVIKHAGKNKTLWAALENWLDTIPTDVDVIFAESAVDKRTKTFKQLQKKAATEECKLLTPPEAIKWLIKEAKQKDVPLTNQLATKLVDRAGTDQWRLANELDKLVVHGEITEALIDTLVEQTTEANVFALLDAVLHKKTDLAKNLLQDAKPTEDPYMLFGLLASNVSQLAALVYAAGKPIDVIAKELGTHPFPLRKLQSLADRTSKNEVRMIVEIVATADERMKTTGIDPWLLLEEALVKIANRN